MICTERHLSVTWQTSHHNPQPYRALLLWVHDDAIKWKHFPCYWPFVRGTHQSPVHSHHKGQWRGALMFLFDLRPNKRLSKQSRRRRFETVMRWLCSGQKWAVTPHYWMMWIYVTFITVESARWLVMVVPIWRQGIYISYDGVCRLGHVRRVTMWCYVITSMGYHGV